MPKGIQVVCPKCKHKGAYIDNVETKCSVKAKVPGIVGSTYNAARGVASIATLGLAGKVLPKASGKVVSTTKVKRQEYVCHNCGHRWKAK